MLSTVFVFRAHLRNTWNTSQKFLIALDKQIWDLTLPRVNSAWPKSSIWDKLSRHGVSACEDKLEVIRSFPTPKNAQQLRSYLGIANYYRRLVEKFSMKTANLRSLLKRDAKFVWNSVHDQEFEFLKNALCSWPILAFPTMQKPYILSTDACSTGISFILSQLDDKGHEPPICFGGRELRKAEINYTVSELDV